jgi:hypothetical protein
MFSIGILGFLVWSLYMVALSCCEIGVKFLAVCWNSSELLSTFYSQNLSSYTQSAGNQNLRPLARMSSSEATRETSNRQEFGPFREFYKSLGFSTFISDSWLSWFIGFAEGDGAILSHKGRPRFVLTQKESLILEHINKILGFGKVSKFGSGKNSYSRYIVDDIKGIILLSLIFNGNLVLFHRVRQLGKWIDDINAKLQNPNACFTSQPIFKFYSNIILKTYLFLPSLNNAWISGFTDAEGTFNVNITVRKSTVTGYRVQLRFILDQNFALNQLTYIRDLFGYGSVIHRKKDTFRYYCESFLGMGLICTYFEKFPLKTKKSISLANWLKVYNMVLNKEHLTEEGLKKVREIKQTININNAQNSKTGSAKP